MVNVPISAGLRGTIGFTSFFTTPFSATSMMHGQTFRLLKRSTSIDERFADGVHSSH